MNSASKGGEETQLAVPPGAKSSTPQKLNVLYMLCPNMPLKAHQPASGPRTRACLGLETEAALPLLASRAFCQNVLHAARKPGERARVPFALSSTPQNDISLASDRCSISSFGTECLIS